MITYFPALVPRRRVRDRDSRENEQAGEGHLAESLLQDPQVLHDFGGSMAVSYVSQQMSAFRTGVYDLLHNSHTSGMTK